MTEILNGLVSLIQPYLLATVVVFAIVAIVRVLAVRLFTERGINTPGWKLGFMLLALLLGLVAGLVGWAPPVSPDTAGVLAGRIGAGFLVAGLAIVNRTAGTRLLRFRKETRPAAPASAD